MSRRKTTWSIVIALAVLAVGLTLKFGVKRTINGLSPEEYERQQRETTIIGAPDGGSQLESVPGRFKAWLPGFPLRSTPSVPSPYGPVVVNAFSHDGTRISCTVSWLERATGDLRTDAELFDEARRNLQTTLDGTVFQQRVLHSGSTRASS